MTVVATHELSPKQMADMTGLDRLQVYNGLDCCVTLECLEEITREHNEYPEIYDFERALQAPYLEIMLRGFRVDTISRMSASSHLRDRIKKVERRINQLSMSVWGRELNPRSPKQLQEFFYGAMKLPEVILGHKGDYRVSTSREALEKLEVYLHARIFINGILTVRDLGKQLAVLETEIDSDGRYRTSYNIAGTETGRASSSQNAFGTGGNAQNIAPDLRYVFVSDPGYRLVNIDLEQVEARDVGFICGCLFDDWKYLDSCESGDVHTNNARLIWPELPWTGDPKQDRAIADGEFYRGYSYRYMAKRGGHLANYEGTPYTASRHLKLPLPIVEDFQARYCRGRVGDRGRNIEPIDPVFPAIPRYWQWVATELQSNHLLSNLFGRRRHFFGRLNDDATIREGIAFIPQSTTADRTNLGLWRVWRYMHDRVQLLAQTHDSITFQCREGTEDDVIPEALERIKVELVAPNGRSYIVPGEAAVGWNWGYREVNAKTGEVRNPDGLVKWRAGADKRTRTTLLQRIIPA